MAASHFTYLDGLIDGKDNQALVAGLAIAGVLTLFGLLSKRKLVTNQQIDALVVPSGNVSAFGIADFVVECFLHFQDSILGRENRRYFPFMATLFFFLLFSNLLGLIPGTPAITASVSITVGFALASFAHFNYHGVREHGVWGYVKHFLGPVWWLAFLIFPLEIFSTLLRILTLNLRLYWNITADHIVLGALTDVLKIGAVPVYILGTFVSVIQAFVFTVLSMVYVLLATQHGDDSHGETDGHGKLESRNDLDGPDGASLVTSSHSAVGHVDKH